MQKQKAEQRWPLQNYSLTFSRSLSFSRVSWSTTEGFAIISWKEQAGKNTLKT